MVHKPLLFVTRMYSGLFESLKANKWNPTGIPTITKLAQAVSQQYVFTWIIVCKTPQESEIVKNSHSVFFFDRMKIQVVPYKRYTSSVGRLNNFLNDINAFIFILKNSHEGKKMYYCDRSNIVVAAMLKLFTCAHVIIRLLGLYPDQKSLAINLKAKLLSPIIWFSYKIRYTLAICTQDGSGIEFYLDRLLNSKTRREVLINGVKKNNSSKVKTSDTLVSLLFVGKLIDDKGILELIDAVTELRNKQNNFILHIIGKGDLEPELRARIKERDLENYIHLVGSVKQSQIHDFYAKAHVYISLNKLGNLSNTVLEAMSMNKCIIMLEKDETTFTDIFTERSIPQDTVIRVNRKNTAKDLAEKLNDLMTNPEKIKAYSRQMEKFSESFLWTWQERIRYELRILEQMAN